MSSLRRVAVVDLGTNSVRLTAAEYQAGAWRVVLDLGEVTRLGAALSTTGAIDPEDAVRTGACLRELVARARGAGVEDIRIVATEVLRAARNGAAVSEALSREVGLPITVLAGVEEANFAFHGATSGLEIASGRVVVLDVGGGSTEYITGESGRVLSARSLPVGALRVTSQWLHRDPVPLTDLERARAGLVETFSLLRGGGGDGSEVCLGVGGSFCALAAWRAGIFPYDPSRVHGVAITPDDVRHALEEWRSATRIERMERWGLSEGRGQVVVGGALVIEALLDALSVERVRVSVHGLRHGLLARLAGERDSRD